eukprot:4991104-Amphidinium_carterae.1
MCFVQNTAVAGCQLGLEKYEGVLDTGAQSACIGESAFRDLCEVLETRFKLRPFHLQTTTQHTHGIGGKAKVLHVWNVPIALGQVP